jgi:glycosyltransferase involved in cell wall biosynthesis
MAMGLPVVSCSSGAIPEIVDDERNGLLVPPNDERALAEAIERLRADAVLRRRLGQAARDTIAERFDITRNVTQRLTLFHSLSAE